MPNTRAGKLHKNYYRLLGNIIEQVQLRYLVASSVYSLIIDKTTDIEIIKEIVIYAHFINLSSDYLFKDC